MSVVLLEDWALDTSDPLDLTLLGTVFGHPLKCDGERVRTSRVVSTNGRRVTTASGTTYELGEVHPDYAIWLRNNGMEVDENHPIRICIKGRIL